MTPEEKIIYTITTWCADNGYEILIPQDDQEIDFVNLNFRSKQMLVGEMGIDELIDD